MTGKRGSAKRHPDKGSWVIASYSDCPDRFYWQCVGDLPQLMWIDQHGCRKYWSELVDPIDALAPELCDGCGRPVAVGHFGKH